MVYTHENIQFSESKRGFMNAISSLIKQNDARWSLVHHLILKSSLIDRFSKRFNYSSEVAYFLLGHHVYIQLDRRTN